MKVFVTGATGFVGTALVKELLNNGHQVLGLARNDAAADKLIAAGAEVHRGDLQDLESLKLGAAASEGVIHAGFIHDFSRFKEVCEIDKIAIDTIAAVLAGSDRPFVITSGTALVNPGKLATEDIVPAPGSSPHPRMSEYGADDAVALGVKASVIRLAPSVHGEGDHHGFVPILINIAREKGTVAYIGEGKNRWNGVHRLDAVKLYRLALEHATAGERFHAVAEESIEFKAIATLIGKHLNMAVESIPAEKAGEHFGWFAGFATADIPASSKMTQERLDWHPTHCTLLEDLQTDIYLKNNFIEKCQTRNHIASRPLANITR